MKKLFGKTKISWKFLIIFSILLGLIIGIINKIPFLENTSFRDIAIVYDMWIILALFVITNSESAKEAVSKCFVFFLISQPMIYLSELLIDIIFYKVSFSNSFKLYFINYYYGAGWLYQTFLTIPGAYIAYQVKRKNILSSIILSVATCYLSLVGTTGLIKCLTEHFPYHLLNSLLCLFFAYYLIFILLNKKRERIISLSLTTIGIILGVILTINNNNKPISVNYELSLDNNNEINNYEITNENIATAAFCEDKTCIIIYSSTDIGKTQIDVEDIEGNHYIYEIESTNNDFIVNKE